MCVVVQYNDNNLASIGGREKYECQDVYLAVLIGPFIFAHTHVGLGILVVMHVCTMNTHGMPSVIAVQRTA